MTTHSQAVSPAGVQCGEERVYALNKLKKSPRNVRKAPHAEAEIEARAASIKAKGLLQPPVVEPELRADGVETGYAFVTAGEGRRLASRLLAKRKVISKTTPVRCLVGAATESRPGAAAAEQLRPGVAAGNQAPVVSNRERPPDGLE